MMMATTTMTSRIKFLKFITVLYYSSPTLLYSLEMRNAYLEAPGFKPWAPGQQL